MRIIKRIGKFYICMFCVIYILGTTDYYVAKSIGHPIFSILYAKYMDGGTQEWAGIGYIITSPNELISAEERGFIYHLPEQPEDRGISVQHGWELNPWPIFELPILGRTLFKKRDVSDYIYMTNFTDYESARHVIKQETDWPGLVEDIFFIVSAFAFGLVWLVFESICRLARRFGVSHMNNT
jgi:hypothetical protein